MKRILVVAALCVAATGAMARSSSSTADEGQSYGGIVTPDVATDGFRTSQVVRDKDGNMLVCPTYRRGVRSYYDKSNREMCTDSMNENAWSLPVNVPPRGKTYVGFRMANGYYEFYWK